MSKETRSCGDCTVCCEGWLVINTDEIKAYPGLACPDVKCGKGCGIYETRPNYPCRTFFCSWAEDHDSKIFPDWMKPNASKAIVVHGRIEWNGRKLDLVVPVGATIPKDTLKWLTQYAKTHNKPFIYAEHLLEDGNFTGQKEVKVFAPLPMRDKILAWLDAGNKFW